MPPVPDPGSDLALYVHWPYCARVCPYCDFAVVAGADPRPLGQGAGVGDPPVGDVAPAGRRTPTDPADVATTANPLRAHADLSLLVSAHDEASHVEPLLYQAALQQLLDVVFLLLCGDESRRRQLADYHEHVRSLLDA